MCIYREHASVLGTVFGSWVQSRLLSRETELQLGRIVQLGLSTQQQMRELSAKQKRSISVELQAAALNLSPSILQVKTWKQSIECPHAEFGSSCMRYLRFNDKNLQILWGEMSPRAVCK